MDSTSGISHQSTPQTSVAGLRIGMALIVGCGYVIDQLTKRLAQTHLDVGSPVPVIDGLLWWSLHHNPGAAFSMGVGLTIGLSVLSLVVAVAMLGWVLPRVQTRLAAVACSLLTAGVLGNLTDRLFRAPGPFEGHVVDFIAVRGFAVFNVADICITTSAGLLVIWSIMSDRKKRAS